MTEIAEAKKAYQQEEYQTLSEFMVVSLSEIFKGIL